MYDWILSMPRERLEERLLSFSDVHLDLLALSAPDVRARIDVIRRRDSDIDTQRRYQELQRVVDKMSK
jgi:hypothetical protein